jgi:hypothetical protein
MTEWKFQDPPNVAVITTMRVLNGEDWVLLSLTMLRMEDGNSITMNLDR